MRKIWNKGHRIRASDKHLVYHFSIGTLLFIFVAVLLLLNMKQLMRTDWEHFSLLENGLTLSPYSSLDLVDAFAILTRDGAVLLSDDAKVTFEEDAMLSKIVKNMIWRREEMECNKKQ